MKRIVWAALMLAAGCSSSSSGMRYIRLPESSYQLSQNGGAPASIKVVLSPSLPGSNMVYQSAPLTLAYAQQHQWAEPLDHALAKAFANALNHQQSRWNFSPMSAKAPVLTLYIEEFQGSFDRSAHLSGYSVWNDGRISRPGQNFSASAPQQGDGYEAMAQALGQTVGLSAQQLQAY